MAFAVAVEHEVVLNRHVAHRNIVFADQGQIAVGSAYLEKTGKAVVGLLGRHRVAVAVVPVQPVGHRLGHVVGVRVAHPRRDRQQHIVGVARRADVQTVGVQVQRRLFEGGRVDRHVATLGRHGGVEEVLNVEARKIVVVVDDQLLAGFDAKRGTGIQVVALARTVGAGSLDQVEPVGHEVGDGLFDRVEVHRRLMCRQPDLEHAVLARQPDRLLERRRLSVRTGVDACLRRGCRLLPAAGGHHRGHRYDDRQRDDDYGLGAKAPHSAPHSGRGCQCSKNTT